MRKPYTITIDGRGDVLVAGPVEDNTSLVFVAKLDPQGNLLWKRWIDPEAEATDAGDRISMDEGLRDSFEPQLIDRPTLPPSSPARHGRAVSALVGLACFATLGIAGGAMARERVQPPATRASAAQAGIDASAIGASIVVPKAGPRRAPVADDLEQATAESEQLDALAKLRLSPDASAAQLRRVVVQLLTRGEAAEARIVAERLVTTEPGHALHYLLLGAALQDLGKGVAAQRIYRRCSELADEGDIAQCRALRRGPAG